jgi:lipoate-protein ligase A
VDRQLRVIQTALKQFGLQVEKTGRNDLTIDGKKFSGNAFYASGDYAYHHGTIMVDVNEGSLMDYLTVSAEKLKAKGVDSVRSRVVNLKQLNSQITIEGVKKAMIAAFSQVYEKQAVPYEFSESAKAQIKKRKDFFASEEWLYGKQKDFAVTFERKFPWGEVSVNLETQKDKIVDAKVYTDALDDELAHKLEKMLLGCTYQGKALLERRNIENKEVDEVIFWISTLI